MPDKDCHVCHGIGCEWCDPGGNWCDACNGEGCEVCHPVSMSKNWSYKQLLANSKPIADGPRPEFQIGVFGFVVRYHADHPRRSAAERLAEKIAIINESCQVFTGGSRFRVDNDTVMRPERFVLEMAGRVKPEDRCRITRNCKTPGCIREEHLEVQIGSGKSYKP